MLAATCQDNIAIGDYADILNRLKARVDYTQSSQKCNIFALIGELPRGQLQQTLHFWKAPMEFILSFNSHLTL